MIRVAVLYPRSEGKRFDLDYYQHKHMPLVKERLAPLKVEIDLGLPNHLGEPSPYIAIGYMTFESIEQLVVGFAVAAAELMADIPNYTDIEPVTQLSEVVVL